MLNLHEKQNVVVLQMLLSGKTYKNRLRNEIVNGKNKLYQECFGHIISSRSTVFNGVPPRLEKLGYIRVWDARADDSQRQVAWMEITDTGREWLMRNLSFLLNYSHGETE